MILVQVSGLRGASGTTGKYKTRNAAALRCLKQLESQLLSTDWIIGEFYFPQSKHSLAKLPVSQRLVHANYLNTEPNKWCLAGAHLLANPPPLIWRHQATEKPAFPWEICQSSALKNSQPFGCAFRLRRWAAGMRPSPASLPGGACHRLQTASDTPRSGPASSL